MTKPRIYRASSLGYSLEQLVCPHLGYDAIPPPEWLQEKFDEGTALEEPILARLEADGWLLSSRQKEVEFDVIPGVAKVVGHLDAIRHYDDRPGRVVEVKTMNGKTWDSVAAKGWSAGGLMEKYKWQQAAYTLATGLGHIMVCYNKATEKIIIFSHDEPFYTIADIANKLQSAEDAINAGVIPEGCTDYPCPYFYLHAPIEDPEPAPADLDTLLDAWKEANRKKKIYEAEERNLREMVKEYVGEIAGKVKGSQGITVSTNWVAEQVVSYTKPAHWETRITSPREKKDG